MKLLFLHGLASSGAYKMASTLRILLRCEVLAPDLPIEPDRVEALLSQICLEEHPDLVVGLSWGGFWAQKLRGLPKVLVNPDFHVSRLMRTKLGEVPYLSPRADGARSFWIGPELCDTYEALEAVQFDGLDAAERALTRGCFATEDELVHCGDEFALHYGATARVDYPGGHLPNYPETKQYLLPVLQSLLG